MNNRKIAIFLLYILFFTSGFVFRSSANDFTGFFSASGDFGKDNLIRVGDGISDIPFGKALILQTYTGCEAIGHLTQCEETQGCTWCAYTPCGTEGTLTGPSCADEGNCQYSCVVGSCGASCCTDMDCWCSYSCGQPGDCNPNTFSCSYPLCPSKEANCFDGLDNDCDKKIDGSDSDCYSVDPCNAWSGSGESICQDHAECKWCEYCETNAGRTLVGPRCCSITEECQYSCIVDQCGCECCEETEATDCGGNACVDYECQGSCAQECANRGGKEWACSSSQPSACSGTTCRYLFEEITPGPFSDCSYNECWCFFEHEDCDPNCEENCQPVFGCEITGVECPGEVYVKLCKDGTGSCDSGNCPSYTVNKWDEDSCCYGGNCCGLWGAGGGYNCYYKSEDISYLDNCPPSSCVNMGSYYTWVQRTPVCGGSGWGCDVNTENCNNHGCAAATCNAAEGCGLVADNSLCPSPSCNGDVLETNRYCSASYSGIPAKVVDGTCFPGGFQFCDSLDTPCDYSLGMCSNEQRIGIKNDGFCTGPDGGAYCDYVSVECYDDVQCCPGHNEECDDECFPGHGTCNQFYQCTCNEPCGNGQVDGSPVNELCDASAPNDPTPECFQCKMTGPNACDTWEPVADGTSCDDGQYCTINDECTSGTCDGDSRSCSDGETCTSDSCDETNDRCRHTDKSAGYDCGACKECDGNGNCDYICAGTEGSCECVSDVCVDCSVQYGDACGTQGCGSSYKPTYTCSANTCQSSCSYSASCNSCGTGGCQPPGENCGTCPADCACTPPQCCLVDTCVPEGTVNGPNICWGGNWVPHCGDGIVNAGEECEDSADCGGNPCESDCTCGDGPIECYSNNDCSDGLLCTQDLCVNAGTTSSYCSNPARPVGYDCGACKECDASQTCVATTPTVTCGECKDGPYCNSGTDTWYCSNSALCTSCSGGSCDGLGVCKANPCGDCKYCFGTSCVNRPEGYNQCGAGCQRCVGGVCADYNSACGGTDGSCYCQSDTCRSCGADVGCCDIHCSGYACTQTPNDDNCGGTDICNSGCSCVPSGSCTVGAICNTGPWQCNGDCDRQRSLFRYDSNCNCVAAEVESDTISEGYHCVAGNEVSTGYCGSGTTSCSQERYRVVNRYECNGAGSCTQFDYQETVQDCGAITYSCLSGCTRRKTYTCLGGSCGTNYADQNCPQDTGCAGGSCTVDTTCGTGSTACGAGGSSCSYGNPIYHCDGAGSCNRISDNSDYLNVGSCNPFSCSSGSCSAICESSCGADAACDGKQQGDSCGSGGTCDVDCDCIEPGGCSDYLLPSTCNADATCKWCEGTDKCIDIMEFDCQPGQCSSSGSSMCSNGCEWISCLGSATNCGCVGGACVDCTDNEEAVLCDKDNYQCVECVSDDNCECYEYCVEATGDCFDFRSSLSDCFYYDYCSDASCSSDSEYCWNADPIRCADESMRCNSWFSSCP